MVLKYAIIGNMYEPKYTITDDILNIISQIEAIRTQVGAFHILPEREVELRYRATVEATHSSTSIEGNPLNLQQVERALSEKTTLGRHQYYEIEVRNYKSALNYIERRKNAPEQPISTDDILTIHRILTKDLLDTYRSGVWRKNPVYIENQDGQKVYDAVATEQVGAKIAELLSWANQKSYGIHPVIASAILHFQFVSIHPFADGNGRTSRVLTMLYLGMRDYDFRGSLVLDSYYSTDKAAYYDSLSAQGDNYLSRELSNLSPWIRYFADGFLASAKVLRAEVALIATAVNRNIPRTKITRDEMDILSYIQQFGSITISEAEGVLERIPRRTIQRKLKNLVDEGLIRTEGSTNDVRYVSVS